MIRRDTAIDELERIRNRLWEIDIPSPTVPEYIEHHEQVQSVMKAVTESVDRIWKEPAQPEKLTDIEQRIFLAAMSKEEKVCGEVDKEPSDADCINLMRVCKSIERKVKGALWT